MSRHAHQNLRETFGSFVRDARKGGKLTTAQLAKLVNTTRPHISTIENGTANIKSGLVDKLAKHLIHTAGPLLPISDTAGAKLRQAREQTGRSIEQVAQMTGLTAYTVGRIERQGSITTIDTVERIARILDCSPLDILAPESFLFDGGYREVIHARTATSGKLQALAQQFAEDFLALPEREQSVLLQTLEIFKSKSRRR